MAVSGRKVSDFSGTISKGSAEDFDHSCEPCLAIGQRIEANGFCMDCNEYLCKTCFSYHQRTKALRHHKLLDKDNMDQGIIQTKGSVVCTEKCHIHNNETIKFFCTNHEFLGCNDCITLNHRTCKIDYIPDKCAGIGDSAEYKETVRKLDQKMKDMDDVIKKATLLDKEIDSSYDHVIKEIIKFRKEIDAHLDLLQNRIQMDAEKKKAAAKETVKNVLATSTVVSSDIKKLKSRLQDSQSSQQNGQLYIMVKQAESKLKLDDVKKAQESLGKSSFQHIFERNKELEKLLTKQEFGELLRKKVFDTLTHREDINVKIKSDKEDCRITGCAALSSNKLVLADSSNNKLKVVDTKRKVVIEEKSLDSGPWDIAVLPQDQISVTLPDKQKVLIMSTAGKLSISRKIPVKARCCGITYHHGQLYMVCNNPLCVIISDTRGNVNYTISLNNEIFATPQYILLSEDARHIYISDLGNHSVVSVTLLGDISAVYKHKDLNGPQGILRLEDGSLLVCCYWNYNIHRISGDLKQGQIILDGFEYPQSICYNDHDQEVYIGGWCDQLKIMKIAWKA